MEMRGWTAQKELGQWEEQFKIKLIGMPDLHAREAQSDCAGTGN